VGVGCQGSVVGSRRAKRLEVGALRFQRLDKVAVAIDGNATGFAESINVATPVECIQIDHGVRAEGGQDACLPARLSNSAVRLQAAGRRVCGAQHFDVESLVQGTRAEGGRNQAFGDLLVNRLCCVAVQLLLDAKDAFKLVRQPHASRCAAKQIEVLGENLPYPSMIGLDSHLVEAWNAQTFQWNAL